MSPTPKRIRRMHSHSVHTMPKKPQIRPNGFVLFDVLYEDGTRTSKPKDSGRLTWWARRRPASSHFVEAQDREIGRVRQTARAHQVDQPLT